MGINNISGRWADLLSTEFEKSYFVDLLRFLDEEYMKDHVYPKRSEVMRAFNLTPIQTVKVVIVGQDPYPNPGMANGLAFGVEDGTFPKPKTFTNIIKELGVELWQKGEFPNALDAVMSINGSSMAGWAAQGVLMLNTCLTTEKGKPGSHRGRGWEKFTKRVLEILAEHDRPIVFLLWGEDAKAAGKVVRSTGLHLVLECGHPSGQASRAKVPFQGCDHFLKANRFLVQQGMQPINWTKISY